MVMLSPLGTPGTYFETGSPRLELAFLRQLHDHRGRHRLGIGSDPEVGVGVGRVRRAQLRGAVGDRELALGGAQENHGAGNQEFLGGRVHHGLQRGLADRLERRRASRGSSAPRYNLRAVLFTERRFFLLGEGRDDKAEGQANGE